MASEFTLEVIMDRRMFQLILDEETYANMINDEEFKHKYLSKLSSLGILLAQTAESQMPEATAAGPSTTTTTPAASTWPTAATHLLITERLQLEVELKKSQYKGRLWSRISASLKDKGHSYLPSECDSKWRNLMGTYRMNLDKRSKSGSGCVRWEWFDIIHEVYAKDVNTQPPTSYITNSCNLRPLLQRNNSESSSVPSFPSPSTSSSSSPLKKKRVRDSESPLWFHNYLKKKKKTRRRYCKRRKGRKEMEGDEGIGGKKIENDGCTTGCIEKSK